MAIYFQDGNMLIDDTDDAVAMHADCCCGIDCTDCCSGHSNPTDIDVDLGTLTLSNGSGCDETGDYDCADLTGVFTLEGFSGCSIGTLFFDEYGGRFCEQNIYMVIWATIRTSGDDCYWQLQIVITIYDNAQNPDRLHIVYESTPKTFVENDCTLASAVTLSLVSTDFNTLCTGSMNATITIEAA